MFNSCTFILIVEDNALVAMALESMVEDLGYWVIGPAHSLEDGLRRAREDEIDFALLDVDLGGRTTSLPIAATLAARRIPFAFTTGAPHVPQASRLHAPVLSKPVLEDDLERVLALS